MKTRSWLILHGFCRHFIDGGMPGFEQVEKREEGAGAGEFGRLAKLDA